jgi:hypothetical protein
VITMIILEMTLDLTGKVLIIGACHRCNHSCSVQCLFSMSILFQDHDGFITPPAPKQETWFTLVLVCGRFHGVNGSCLNITDMFTHTHTHTHTLSLLSFSLSHPSPPHTQRLATVPYYSVASL